VPLTLPPLSLYIHIPWCVRKCPYCDFNSHNAPEKIPQVDYVKALLDDLEQDLPLVEERPVVSIFFGGGTPSLFSPENIARILDGVGARLTLRSHLEITLETNPGTVEHGCFKDYQQAGINRISFGVQSFHDDSLRRLGRIHNASQAERAIKEAQDAGIENINLDLMYVLPEQTVYMAIADVEKAIFLQPKHISHYQLTLEPNTPFAVHPPALPDDDNAWEMQQQCQIRLTEAGYVQYEVSAYALPEFHCYHNENYWRFGDYLGIGAGAHAKITNTANNTIQRLWKVKHPRAYMDHAATIKRLGGDNFIDPAQLPFEFMLNALRLTDGFLISDFENYTGLVVGAIQPQLNEAFDRNWLRQDRNQIKPTELGQRFLNDVIEIFLP